ncbi:MAG: GDP-mannose 4,6-dehydratase [Phycisphaerales bacterium]|nr:GDP-mannose 4,6-dehydratase [Phycisphaerales bacterium]
MTSRPILLTGAAGFIGSHTAEALLRAGRRVVGLDNFDPYYDASLKRANLSEVEATARRRIDSRFEFVEGDITDRASMKALFARFRPEGLIHLAARAGVRPSIADPAGYAHTNVTGTSVLLDQCAALGVDRIVVASSSSVYGTINAGEKPRPFREDQSVEQPISPYAATKRACELVGYTHHHLTKQPVAMLRFFTVFGPRQRPDLAIRLFLTKIAKGEPIQLFGEGSTSRDYTFIDDIVGGVLSAYDRIPQHGYRVWNLGNSHPITLDEMVSTIAKVVGKEPNATRAAAQAGDVRATWADPERAAAELGFRAKTSFEDGVRKQWEWLKTRL